MGVTGNEYPRIALGLGLQQENRGPFSQDFRIFIIIAYPAALYPPNHNVTKKAGTMESVYPEHTYKLLLILYAVKQFDILTSLLQMGCPAVALSFARAWCAALIKERTMGAGEKGGGRNPPQIRSATGR